MRICLADIGRHIALDLSELGYTVFVLCPDRYHGDLQTLTSSTRDASNVSSVREIRIALLALVPAMLNASNQRLIQDWHQRIKRSGHSPSPWGLVAPIVLDMTSSTQRIRAVETVEAYCATHSLHLVAVIVQPAPGFTSTWEPPFPRSPRLTPIPPPTPIHTDVTHTSTHLASKPGREGLDVTAWGGVVSQCLVQPISIVQDYMDLLAAATGRVVLLHACGQPSVTANCMGALHLTYPSPTAGDQVWSSSLHKDIILSAARYLRQELDTLSIKVSTVFIGPFAPSVKFPELTHHEAG